MFYSNNSPVYYFLVPSIIDFSYREMDNKKFVFGGQDGS